MIDEYPLSASTQKPPFFSEQISEENSPKNPPSFSKQSALLSTEKTNTFMDFIKTTGRQKI
jgi:hypothetical protein